MRKLCDMTKGHKHRLLTVSSWDAWYVRLLRRPLVHRRNLEKVDASPYPYGPCVRHEGIRECWTLSLLGILHRWTGLTLYVEG